MEGVKLRREPLMLLQQYGMRKRVRKRVRKRMRKRVRKRMRKRMRKRGRFWTCTNF